jgi:Phage capsid family
MLTYVRQLTTERESLTASATSLTDAAATEARDLTETEQASLRSWSERCAAIDTQLGTLDEQMQSQRAYAALRGRLDATEETPEDPARGMQTRGAPVPQDWGSLFVNSEEFRAYNGRGSSGEVALPGLFTRVAADPITVGGFPGGLPPYYFSPTPWKMTTPLLDALGKIATNSGTVQWYSWPGAYPPAAVVPEAAAKPPADFEPTPHTDALETYAHYKALSRQALEDIPQIQSIVENALRGGVLTALEAAAAGALADAGSGIPSITNADLLAGIRIAVGDVQSRGYANPNAVLLNPADFANMDLAVMAATVNGPTRTGSVWGVPAIAVGAIPAGTAYVGDFQTAVTLFARDQVSAFMTDSHDDFFIKNLLVILAEQRALIAVTEPHAAEQVVVSAGGTQAGPATTKPGNGN